MSPNNFIAHLINRTHNYPNRYFSSLIILLIEIINSELINLFIIALAENYIALMLKSICFFA